MVVKNNYKIKRFELLTISLKINFISSENSIGKTENDHSTSQAQIRGYRGIKSREFLASQARKTTKD